MSDELRDTLESLERAGWDALCSGTGTDFYGELMTTDSAMVLANGAVLTRPEVVASLRDAPAWDGYELSEVRLVTTGRDGAALVYRARAHRAAEPDFVAAMSSVYVRVDGRWRLALYTQTPQPDAAA
ncbi:MAG: nuclear transport factor 2 family protein [Nocardioides sp.]